MSGVSEKFSDKGVTNSESLFIKSEGVERHLLVLLFIPRTGHTRLLLAHSSLYAQIFILLGPVKSY